ncbi:MAG: hypothetical protein JWR85_819 [Marmoricola sp.]|nr:hypothetical protein [Marmoricola sp.]
MTDRPRWLRFTLVALDFTLPVALFYVLRAAGVSAYLALLAGALASLVSAGISLLRDRRVNGVAAFMTTMLVLSTIVSLVGGGPRFLLARDAWLTGAAGFWFIASCWTPRPLAYHFARAIGEGRFGWPPDFEARWERAPRFRRMWRVASVLWGIGTLLDAVLRWVMAYSLPIDVVPALTQALFIVTGVVLFVVTNVYYVLSGAMNWSSPLYDAAGELRKQTASSWRPPPRQPSGSRSASS